jgi:hypothetical protein
MKTSFIKAMNGLSAQYAGEHLSSVEKIRVLNDRPVAARISSKPNESGSAQLNESRVKAHIAMLCNDATNQHVLDYVLDNSNDCQVDILYHGTPNTIQSESFYKQAKKRFVENNIDIRLVKLISESIIEIKDYLILQGSLQYLVTDSKDNLIKDFLNNKKYKGQVNVPIVLIN